MPILTKGVDFTTGDQVTAANLDNLVDAATFASGAVDNSTTALSGGAIIVKDGGITTAKLASSLTLTTPNIGTPSAGTLTNCTGLPISTGVSGLGTGVATFLATPSSANLASAVTDETGSGALVFATSPTLVTPALGTPASGNLANCTGYVGTSALVTVGALNSGSITSGFGSIDIGTDTLAAGNTTITGTLNATVAVSSTQTGFTGTVTTGTADGVYAESGGIYSASANGSQAMQLRRRTSDGSIALFYRDTTNVGSISVTTTATAYNTSSDARLKTNVRPIENSGVIVDALKPSLFDWKTGEKDSYGFIAQEVYKVFPQAVKKGDDGDVISEQWAMDAAKLVPVLVAELKALRARVAALEAKP